MSALAETAGSWRVAVRLARRAAWRNKARTLLIVLMLTLPVYAGTVIALSYASTYTSADAEATWPMGQADYEVSGLAQEKLLATLPAGSQTAHVTYGRTVVRAGDSYSLRDSVAADVGDPLTRGMFVVRAGRAPRGPAEAAVSARLAAALGIHVGDPLAVGAPPRERTVVGIVDAARELSIPLVLTSADQKLSGDLYTLVKLPPGAAWSPESIPKSMKCEDLGGGAQSCYSAFGFTSRRDVQPDEAELATRAAAFVLVVGFAGTQVALLAGAAFAIGARRQRRELAMVGAVGAGRAQVARMVLANGLLLGAVAGASGVGFGTLTYWLNRGRVERIANHPLTDGAVPVVWLAAIALFAVAVGLLAACGPARGTARQALRAALSGREPIHRASNLRWFVSGLLVCAAGAAMAVVAAGPTGSIVTVTVGTVAVLLGITAFAPVLVALLGRTAARLPLATRLAARHAARHRLRTAASVAAVCTAVAGSMALMVYNAAESTENAAIQPKAHAGQVLVPAKAATHLTADRLRAVERELPTRASLRLTVLAEPARGVPAYPKTGLPVDPSRVVAVGGAEVIRAVTGAKPPPAALAALRDGGAVAFYPTLVSSGHLAIGDRARLPATLVAAPDYYTDLPGAVISERTAVQRGLASTAGGIVFDATRPPTAAELAAVNSHVIAAQVEATPPIVDPAHAEVGARPDHHRDYGPMFLVLAAVSTVVTLAATAVAVGLTTSEMRNDLSTLAAVGAGPRLRRRIAAVQAGLIVGVGVLLGVAGGIAPAAGMVAFRRDLAWHVPWLPLALTVLFAPALAVAATALLTRPRLVLVRRLG